MSPTGVSANGIERMTAVANPAAAVVRIRTGRPDRPSSSSSSAVGQNACRIVTTATSGTRIPSWGLMIAAMTV